MTSPALRLVREIAYRPTRERVKCYWRDRWNPCSHGRIIFEALPEATRSRLTRVVEFGASWGGNLKYFMDRLPNIEAVGIDINPAVLTLAQDDPRYRGIVGDEQALTRFGDRTFGLAFTVSVLDHLPYDYLVEEVIVQLVRIAGRVMLLEPFIEGVHGDVSGKTRNQVKPGLERGHKPFAAYSYVWNYDRLLRKHGLAWQKAPMPLHAASLGPFYHLYQIQTETNATS